MARDAYSVATNESSEDIQHWQEATPPQTSGLDALKVSPEEYQLLDSIQHRVLWLDTLMIHHANHVRSNTDDLRATRQLDDAVPIRMYLISTEKMEKGDSDG